jgi:hypothetical protein
MASTLLNEQGWHPDLIELQLAHAERNKVRAAYNKAQRLAERRTMMQAWADYIDGLKAGGQVTPIHRERTSVEERQAVLTVAHAWRAFRVFRLCVRRRAGWYPLGSAEDCQGARPAVSRIRKTSTRAAARS